MVRDSAVLLAILAGVSVGSLAGSVRTADAVVYCTYIGYPKGCVARPGVRLYPRPVGAVTASRPGNWNGGVNRVGRRR